MKKLILPFLLLAMASQVYSQASLAEVIQYEPNGEFPFGRPNPDAATEVKDFEPMIGRSECLSINRNPDGTWQDTVKMYWDFKYILNGTAVQDITWKEDKVYASSIRQFIPDSAKWYVTYFSSLVSPAPSTWAGARSEDQIVLYLPQNAPNGMEGNSRLTFKDFSKEGYNWRGEWVSQDESIVYPFWLIYCKKTKFKE